MTRRTDARGVATNYRYDALNRVDCTWTGSATPACPAGSQTYTFDEVGNRKTMVDMTGTTTYNYDWSNRISSVTLPGPKTVSYEYDKPTGGTGAPYPGQRTKITYPDTSKYATYTYLADGRMSTVTDWLSRQTSYTYDSAGRMTRTDFPNGLWTTHSHYANDSLANVEHRNGGGLVGFFNYQIDAAGNRTQLIHDMGTTTYQYDALHRPTSGASTYTYDANGNRLTKGATSYSYNAADEMTSAGGVTYGYDNNGNQTSRGADTFTYDHENRLTQSVIGGVTSSSTYNGDGLRMSHTVSGATTGYTWDVAADLPVILEDGSKTNVYGIDLVSATDSSGNQNYYMHDGIGSVSNIFDYAGVDKAEYFYEEFGLPTFTTENTTNYWRFTGEQRDSQSGLDYLRARYFDPAIGRFLARDPVSGEPPYAYARNNPVNLTDPRGTSPNAEGGFRAPGCNPILGCWHINYDKILEKLPEYLACVSFGLALVAFLRANPWLAAATIGVDVGTAAVFGDEDAAESGAAGAFGAGAEKALEKHIKHWKPKYQRWDETGVKGFGKTLSAFALGYSGWGCAQKVRHPRGGGRRDRVIGCRK